MKDIDLFKETLKKEGEALIENSSHFTGDIEKAIELISKVKGKLIVIAVGKSGHIGKKIAATMSSTGTPAFFIHADEAAHGDLGMITKDDVTLLISNSGETPEVLNIIPNLNKIGVKIISITGNKESSLSKQSDVSLSYSYKEECDDLHLAPTISSTLTLAFGDALAVVLSKKKNFTKEDFHLYHPGGSLGKKLSDKNA